MKETNKEWEKVFLENFCELKFGDGTVLNGGKSAYRVIKSPKVADDILLFISRLLSQKDTEWKERVRRFSFIDSYIKYKNDKRFTSIDEILDIGIKEDLLAQLKQNLGL